MNIKLRTILNSQLCSSQYSTERQSQYRTPLGLQPTSPHTPIISKYRLFSLEHPQSQLTSPREELSSKRRDLRMEDHKSPRYKWERRSSVMSLKEEIPQDSSRPVIRRRLLTECKQPLNETYREVPTLKVLQKTYRFRNRNLQSPKQEERESLVTVEESQQEVRFLPEIRNTNKSTYLRKSGLINKNLLKQYHQQRQRRRQNVLQIFRKCTYTIVFTIRLKKFSRQLKILRNQHFKYFLKHRLLDQLQQLKFQLLNCSAPFLHQIANMNSELRIFLADSPLLAKEKIKVTRELIILEMESLERVTAKLQLEKSLGELLYLLCGHGSPSCNHSIFTAQQLNWLCVSPLTDCLCANRQLQHSSLLFLVLIKLLVFNILLQPQSLHWQSYVKVKLASNNLQHLGNMMYALLVDLHDDLLQGLPSSYPLGNWNHFKSVSVSDSMTVREGFLQEMELISGLKSRKYMLGLIGYEFRSWFGKKAKHILQQLQEMMVDYHGSFSAWPTE